MNLKGLLIILIMIILSVFFSRYYVCEIRRLCNESPALIVDDSDSVTNVAPPRHSLVFAWNQAMPIMDSSYHLIIDSIVANAGVFNQVRLIGMYYAKEDTNFTTKNMGYARALALKSVLASKYDTALFLVDAEMIAGLDSSEFDYFEAMKYEYVAWSPDTQGMVQSKQVTKMPDQKAAAKAVVDEKEEKVSLIQETEEMTILRFPEDVDREKSALINRYIDKLAAELRTTRGVVLITGYSDNVGDDNVNMGIALKRADLLKQELIRKGVSENLILIESMGEANPVASNATKSGRYKNRRLVIKKL